VSYPKEFADVLSPKGQTILSANGERMPPLFGDTQERFRLRRHMIQAGEAAKCVRFLDEAMYCHLERINARIPTDSIARTTVAYGEVLEKVMCVKSVLLQRRTARAYQVAAASGILGIFQSHSFKRFAEAVTGLQLDYDDGCQILCYEHGDYVGPHTDHYPESTVRRDGYVDIHVMFSNDHVSHQWLIYEERGHLSRIEDVNLNGAVAVYGLPFWHYTTPLVGKRGRERRARRWVILRTFGLRRRTQK